MKYRCHVCGVTHEDFPDLGFDWPDPYLDVPEDERAQRTSGTRDACVVRDGDQTHYFVRGVILIPIVGTDDYFGIGAWVSQSAANFHRYVGKEAMDPTLGWLSNRIPFYDTDTFALKCQLCFTNDGERPDISLMPTDHILCVAQREGMTIAEIWKLLHQHMLN